MSSTDTPKYGSRNATAQTTANETSCRTAWGTARYTGCVYEDISLRDELRQPSPRPEGPHRGIPALQFPLLRKGCESVAALSRAASAGPSDASMFVKLALRAVLEESVEVAGEVALEAAGCFAAAFAFLDATVDVGDRRGVGSAAGDEDHVQGAVESAVSAAVEAVADGLPEEAGIGAQPARRANAASLVIRPRCDQEISTCAARADRCRAARAAAAPACA